MLKWTALSQQPPPPSLPPQKPPRRAHDVAATSTGFYCGDSDDSVDADNLQNLLEQLQRSFADTMSEVVKSRIEELTVQANNNNNNNSSSSVNNMELTALDAEQREQIKDIVQMVYALKAQFEQIQSQIAQATESQRALECQVRSLQRDRTLAAAAVAGTGAATSFALPQPLSRHGERSPCHTPPRRRGGDESPAVASNSDAGSCSCCPLCSRPMQDDAATARPSSTTAQAPPSPAASRNSRDGSRCSVLAGERYLSPLLKSFIASLPGPGEPPSSDGGQSDTDGHGMAAAAAVASVSVATTAVATTAAAAATTTPTEQLLPAVIMRKKKSSAASAGGNESRSSGCAGATAAATAEAAELQHRSVSQIEAPGSSADSDGVSLTSSQSGSSKGRRKSSAHSSSGRTPSSAEGISRRAHRYRIVKELTESERNYCSTLRIILEHYQQPLIASGHVSAADCQTLFPPSLRRIYDYHCGILRTLEDRMATWKSRDVVGDIFAHFTEAHERPGCGAGYREYIENFSTAVATVGRLERSSERFRRIVKVCDSQSPARHGLVSLLMFPVRRLPNYVLMLQELLKYTDPNHPDEFYIPSCLSKFSDILRAMDSSVEQTLHSSSELAAAPPSRGSSDSSLLNSRNVCVSSGDEVEDDEDHKASSTTTKDSGIYSNNDDSNCTLLRDGAEANRQATNVTQSGSMLTLPRPFLKKHSALNIAAISIGSHATLGSKNKNKAAVLEKSRWESEDKSSASYGLSQAAAAAVGATLPRAPAKAPLKRSKSQAEVLQQRETAEAPDEPRFTGELSFGLETSPRVRRSILLLKTAPSQDAQLRGGKRTTLASIDYENSQTLPSEYLDGETTGASTESLHAKPSHRGKVCLTLKASGGKEPRTSSSQPDLLGSSTGTLSSPEDLLGSPADDVQPKKKTFGRSLRSLFSKKRSTSRADGDRKESISAAATASDGTMLPPSPASLHCYLDAHYDPPKAFAGCDSSSDDGLIGGAADMHDCVDASTHLDMNTYEDENGEPYSAV